MSRTILTLCGLLVVVSSGCAVHKNTCNDPCESRGFGWCDGTLHREFWRDYYRNKHWPMPFRAMDTSAVLSHFEVQKNNGWRLNNTVGAPMFTTETCQLNESGHAHVKWIVTRAPQNRRVVFVLEGKDQQETAKRVEAVQIAISALVPTGPLPEIYLTDEDAPGSSGIYQTAVSRAINTTVPQPRLPVMAAAGRP